MLKDGMDIRLHMLEAGGSLNRWRSRMIGDVDRIRAGIDALVAIEHRQGAVDVLVRRADRGIVPELGLGGSCYEPHLVTIAIAPESDAFEGALEAGVFRQTLAHELHHALRCAACGYGETFGDALVSEGLADHFAVEATGCEPLLWTQSPGLSPTVLQRAHATLAATTYDHEAWFFGGDDLPRWAGYALGWQLVAAYLARHPGASAAGLVGVEGSVILSAAWPDLVEGRAAS